MTLIAQDGCVEMQRCRCRDADAEKQSWVLLSICAHQNLHQPTYVSYPKLDCLADRQLISCPACLFLLPVSDFLLLAVMAYDSYLLICKPLQEEKNTAGSGSGRCWCC